MKQRIWLGWILALGLLTGAVVALLVMPVVKVWEIKLPSQADTRVDEQALKTLLKPFEGRHFLTLPLERVREAVVRHPWVADAKVVRIWPDRVSIEVVLQKPVARWGARGLVNDRGEVFYPENLSGFERLLVLKGPDERDAPELLTMAVWMREQTALMDWRLLAVKRHVGGSVETLWWPQRTVWLEALYYRQQFSRFLEAWPEVNPVLREAASSIDLRYSNGFSLRTRQLNGSDN